MEASQAGLAGGQSAAQGQGEGEGVQQQQGPDTAALAEQLGQLSSGQEELRQFLMSAPWQAQEAEGEQDGQDLDLSFLDAEDPGFDPNTIADRLGGLIEQAVEQRVAPQTERLAQLERAAEADRLVAEFPEMGSPETANEVVKTAGDLAQAVGRPEIANEPWFWRLTYMAGRAADHANEEGAGAPDAAHLEGAGGAGPGGGQQVDLGQQIVDAKRGRGVLPFRAETVAYGDRTHGWSHF